MPYDDRRRRMDKLRPRSNRSRTLAGNSMETIQGSCSHHKTHSSRARSQTLSKPLNPSRIHPGTPKGLNIQDKSLRISRYPGLPPLLAKRTLIYFRINNDLIKNSYPITFTVTYCSKLHCSSLLYIVHYCYIVQ